MQILGIDSFPTDGSSWRLDWVGDVFYRRQYRYTQPFIRIALSKVSLERANSWSYPTSFDSWPEHVHLSVPVSTLPALRVGTIWRDGSIHSEPEYSYETFHVTVNRDSTTLVKAGLANDDGNFLLPFEAHPYHRAHTHSYCLHVSVANGGRVIVPSAELIRFYFGSSTTFLGRLFQGPFQDGSFWNHAEIDEAGTAKIGLANGISGASAADVARIALDPVALHAAKLISHSLMARSGPEDRSYPKMIFPFTGSTHLTSKGIWLKGITPPTFLVFQILSCTHRFPFTKLSYTMQKRQASRGADAADGKSDGHQTVLRKSPTAASARRLAVEPPDSRWQGKEWRFQSASRFPDLDRKQINRADPMTAIRVIVTNTTELSVGVALGDGEGRTGIRPIDFISVNDAPIPKGHPLQESAFASHMRSVVRKLENEGKSVWFIPLDLRQRFPQFSVMPEIVSQDGEIHPLSYFEDNGRTRPRYVTILRVVAEHPLSDEAWVLPEFEGIENSKDTDLTMIFSIEQDTVVDACWIAGRIAHSVKVP